MMRGNGQFLLIDAGSDSKGTALAQDLQGRRSPSVIFSRDRTQGEVSLRHLGQELEPHAAEVKFIATGHTGTVAGFEPLLSFGCS
jgi:hypothetical protein